MVANSCSKLNCSRLLTEIVRRTSTTIERTCANKNKNHFNSRVKKGTPSIYGYRVLLSSSSQLKEQRKDLRKLNSQIPKGINEKSNEKTRNCLKRGKMRVTKLHLIGWEGGASSLDQSQSEVKQDQWDPGSFETQLKIAVIHLVWCRY